MLISFELIALDQDLEEIIKSGQLTSLKEVSQERLDGTLRNKDGFSALHFSILNKKNEVTRYLLERELGVHASDYLGRTNLMLMMIHKAPADLIELYIGQKINLKNVDRHGRDVLFYVRHHDSEAVREKVKSAHHLQKDWITQDKQSLKSLLKAGDYKKLKDEIEIKRGFSLSTMEVIAYLEETQVIDLWDLKVLSSLGLSLYDKDLALFLARKGLFTQLDSIWEMAPIIDENKTGENFLSLCLTLGAPEHLLIRLIQRQIEFDYKDDQGNTYLHLAAKHSGQEVINLLKKKGLSPKTLNKRGENMLMIMSQNSAFSDEEIMAIYRDHPDAHHSMNAEREDSVMTLARVRPSVFSQLIPDLRQAGYDFTRTDRNGVNALSLVSGRSNVDRGSIEQDIRDIPNLDVEDVPTLTVQDHVLESLNELSDEDAADRDFLGDRLFDTLIAEGIDLLTTETSTKYSLWLKEKLGRNSRELSKLQKELEKIQEDITHEVSLRDRQVQKLSEAQQKVQLLEKQARGQLESENVVAFRSDSKGFQEQLNHFQKRLTQVNEDFSEFGQLKGELEAVLYQFKNGQDEISLEIDAKRSSLSRLKTRKKDEVQAAKNGLELSLSPLRDALEEVTQRINLERKSFDDSKMQIAKNEESINKAVFYIGVYTNNENHPNHNPATCRWTRLREKTEESLTKLRAQSLSLQSASEQRYRFYQDAVTSKRNAENNYNKLKSSYEEELKETLAHIEERYSDVDLRIKNEIDSLELAKDLEYSEVEGRVKGLKEYLIQRYGDIDLIENDWNISLAYAQQLATEQGQKEAFHCGFFGLNSELCTPHLSKDIKQTRLGAEVWDMAQDLASSYGQYKKSQDVVVNSSHVLKELDRARDDFEKQSGQLETSQKRIASLLETRGQLSSSLQTDLSHMDQNVPEVLNYETRRFMNVLLDHQGFSSDSRLEELKDKYGLNKVMLDFIETPVVRGGDLLELNDLDFHKKHIVVKIYNNEESLQMLTRWARNLIEDDQLFGIKKDKKVAPLLALALTKNIVVKQVAQKEVKTLLFSTPKGEFLLGEDGRPIQTKNLENLAFEIELSSQGEIREKLESLLAELRDLRPGYTLEDLKSDHNLSIVLGLIEMADKIENAKLAREIIDYVQLALVPFRFAVPPLNAVSLGLGLGTCAYDIFNSYQNTHFSSAEENFLSAVNCISNIMVAGVSASFFPEDILKYIFAVSPSNLLTNIMNYFFNSKTITLKSYALFSEFMEKTLNLKLNQLVFDQFVKEGSLFVKVENYFFLYASSSNFTINSRLYYNNILLDGLSFRANSSEEYAHYEIENTDLVVINICKLSKRDLSTRLNEKLDDDNVQLKFDKIYKIDADVVQAKGSICLLLKKN